MKHHTWHYRQRAIARRRDPEQDAKNEAAGQALRDRVAAYLAASPLIQQLNAACALAAPEAPASPQQSG